MTDAREFLSSLRLRGFRWLSGVPCSYLTPLINASIMSKDFGYIPASNEGDAVAAACGATVGGHRAVALFQNSGLGNAVSPLTSLTAIFKIPVLLIVTHRGEPGGEPDEPQHELMGAITTQMLDLMGIPWLRLPSDPESVNAALDQAMSHLDSRQTPFALVVSEGAFHPVPLKESDDLQARAYSQQPTPKSARAAALPTRKQAMEAIQLHVSRGSPATAIVATTGHTGRELYGLKDLENQFYMVGSMGCASSFALGLALAQPEREVIVIDGDGAALMRMGNLPTVGYLRPRNLRHVLLDNGSHSSTGGQRTVSHSVDFCEIARASGYPRVRDAASGAELQAELAEASELTFIYLQIDPAQSKGLPRPAIRPPEVRKRFETFLGKKG